MGNEVNKESEVILGLARELKAQTKTVTFLNGLRNTVGWAPDEKTIIEALYTKAVEELTEVEGRFHSTAKALDGVTSGSRRQNEEGQK